jgi:hypothetical protein
MKSFEIDIENNGNYLKLLQQFQNFQVCSVKVQFLS